MEKMKSCLIFYRNIKKLKSVLIGVWSMATRGQCKKLQLKDILSSYKIVVANLLANHCRDKEQYIHLES